MCVRKRPLIKLKWITCGKAPSRSTFYMVLVIMFVRQEMLQVALKFHVMTNIIWLESLAVTAGEDHPTQQTYCVTLVTSFFIVEITTFPFEFSEGAFQCDCLCGTNITLKHLCVFTDVSQCKACKEIAGSCGYTFQVGSNGRIYITEKINLFRIQRVWSQLASPIR